MLESGRRGSREPWWGRGGTFRNKGDNILWGKWKCKKQRERCFSFFSRDTLERLDLGLGFPGGTSGKELPDNPGCLVWFDPWVRRMLWQRKWQLTHYLYLENHMDKGAWQATVHRVIKSQTHLSTNTQIYVVFLKWRQFQFRSVQFSSVTQSCPTLCNLINRSMPGLPAHHQLPEFTQTHVHQVSDAIQPSHPLSSPFPPAPNPTQHQNLFQRVRSSHEVAKVLQFQL